MKERFIKNTAIYIGLRVVIKAFTFLSWILIAKLVVPEVIGKYNLAAFVIDFFIAMSVFGTDAAVIRYVQDKNSGVILSNVIAICSTAFVGVALIVVLTRHLLPVAIPGLHDILSGIYLVLFLMIIPLASVMQLALCCYMARQEAWENIKIELMQIVPFSAMAVIFSCMNWGVMGLIVARTVSSVIPAAAFAKNELSQMSLRLVSLPKIKELLNYGSPLMLRTCLGTIMIYFSRIMLDRFTSLTVLGIFSFFLMISLNVDMLFSAFNQSWTPRVFQQYAIDRQKTMEDIKFMVYFVSFLYLVALASGIVLGKLVLFRLLFRPEYLPSVYMLYVLLLNSVFTAIYTVCYPLFYYRNTTKRIFGVTIVSFAVQIVSSFIFVKYYGQNGALASSFIVSAVSLAGYLLSFKRSMDIPNELVEYSLLVMVLIGASDLLFVMYRKESVFLLVLLLGMALAFKKGMLHKRMYLLWETKRILFS